MTLEGFKYMIGYSFKSLCDFLKIESVIPLLELNDYYDNYRQGR